MGSSRDIAIGPVAVVSLLLGTLLQNEIDPRKNPIEYRRLAFTATFFAGITQATLGIFRYLKHMPSLNAIHIYKCLTEKEAGLVHCLTSCSLFHCEVLDLVLILLFLSDWVS